MSIYSFGNMRKFICGELVTEFYRFKDIREDRDLLQTDIAKVLNTTQCQYSLYENGIRSMPIEKLIILAKYYDVSVDYILGLTNERKPYPKAK